MLRKLALALFAVLFSLAFAQVISPTFGPDDDDAVGVGDSTATVQQQVVLNLPPKVALHLDTTRLEFNLADIGNQDGTWVCVAGLNTQDVKQQLGGEYWNQMQTLPLGTSYQPDGTWNPANPGSATIKVLGGVQITQYPPIRTSEAGELVAGSKNHFVCYRTFILQKFSNHTEWDLSVSRAGDADFQMYIQDNTICSFNEDGGTGLYELVEGSSVRLLPARYTNDTTGNLSHECLGSNSIKSWLDDLVVVAVKVNGDAHGENTETLTYSITSPRP